MKYGTSVCGDDWEDLMEKARERASITGQRIKVLGIHNSERSKRIMGANYSYIIMASEDPNYKKRCAKTGPNGKPCLLSYASHSVTHLSRGFESDTFVAWFYMTKNNSPTSLETPWIHSSFFTAEELQKEGYKVDV
jgi:hypothetical protein